MAEGADVTIRYAFLPTEASIREGAKQLEKTVNKQVRIPEHATAKKIVEENEKIVKSITKTKQSTMDFFVNLSRMISPRVQLPTKLVSGGKVAGLDPEKDKTAGQIVGLLATISASTLIVAGFFEAVGPMLKVLIKVMAATFLILLVPILKALMPYISTVIKAIINLAKALAGEGALIATISLVTGVIGGFLALIAAGKIISMTVDLITGAVSGLLSKFFTAAGTAIIAAAKATISMITGFVDPLIVWLFASGLGKVAVSVFAVWAGLNIGFAIGQWLKDNLETRVYDSIRKAIINALLSPFLPFMMAIKLLFPTVDINLFSVALEEVFRHVANEFVRTISLGLAGISTEASLKQAADRIASVKATSANLASAISAAEALKPVVKSIANMFNNSQIPGGGDTYRYNPVTGKTEKQDFISRPGAGIQAFSPSDTIIGMKHPEALGGTNITNNLYVSAGVDKNEFRKILSDFNREQARELRMRTSYSAGTYA